MLQIHKKKIRDLFEISLQQEIQRLSIIDKSGIKYQSLSDEQINELVERISVLPDEYRNILYSKYCFEDIPSMAEKILGIESALGKSRYIQKLLSIALGLTDSWIDDLSMKKASQRAILAFQGLHIALVYQLMWTEEWGAILGSCQISN
jgi:hypothetical protein